MIIQEVYILKKKSTLLNVILFLMPFALIPELFLINEENFADFVKIFIFFLTSIFLFFRRLHIKSSDFLVYTLIIYYFSVSILYDRSADDLLNLSLSVFPLLLLLHRQKIETKIPKYFFYWVILLVFVSLIYVVMSPTVYYGEKYRLAFLAAGPHSSAYSIAIIYLFVFWGYVNNYINKSSFYTFTLISLYILYGYGARNVELGVFLFIVSYLFFQSNLNKGKKFFLLYFLFTILIVIGFTFYDFMPTNSFDINEFSSGRIYVWLERVIILINLSWEKIIFGQGYGADIMTTEQWWWDAKASHNDFLSFIFNGGIVLFVLYVLIFAKMFRAGTNFQKSAVMFLVITSATNTGLFMRPIHLFFFLFLFLIDRLALKKEKYK